MSAAVKSEREVMDPPPGWSRVHPGRPLIQSKTGDKVRLQWCPVDGCSATFRPLDGEGAEQIDLHFLNNHRPTDLGLSPMRTGDVSLDYFGGDEDAR